MSSLHSSAPVPDLLWLEAHLQPLQLREPPVGGERSSELETLARALAGSLRVASLYMSGPAIPPPAPPPRPPVRHTEACHQISTLLLGSTVTLRCSSDRKEREVLQSGECRSDDRQDRLEPSLFSLEMRTLRKEGVETW